MKIGRKPLKAKNKDAQPGGQASALKSEEAILRAATSLFAERGMNGTTTRDIARLAGVNIAALHYYWGGKDDLLKAVYQQVVGEVASLATKVFSSPVGSLREALTLHLGALHDFFVAHPNYARIIMYWELESPAFLNELRRNTILPLIRHVSDQLRALIHAGKIRKIDPEPTLMTLYGFLIGHFACLSGQKDCMGGTIEDRKIAKRFREQWIEIVLLTFGLMKS